MAYNPDGDPADFDPSDPETVHAFLNDPGNVEMWKTLGRWFRELPDDVQAGALLERLSSAVERRDEVAALLATENRLADDSLHELHAACVREVDALANRIAELVGPVPDHP